MEQELRKCIFDERETGLVYLQNVPEESVGNTDMKYKKYNFIRLKKSK